MAQKRLSDFFPSVSKQTRNEDQGEAVEQQELDQKNRQEVEKDKQEVEKDKQVNTTTLWKFRVEWKQLYPWLDYKDGKMFCLWSYEYSIFELFANCYISLIVIKLITWVSVKPWSSAANWLRLAHSALGSLRSPIFFTLYPT